MITLIVEAGAAGETALARTLSAFVPGALDGLIGDALVADCGLSEGRAAVAEAAGAALLGAASPAEIVAAARGDWLLLVEAGAEPCEGWMGPVGAWAARGAGPARFTLAGTGGWGFLTPFRRKPPLRAGFLLPARLAAVAARSAASLEDLARGRAATRLAARLVPAEG